MARLKGSKDKNPRKKRGPQPKVQFCPKGHDTFVTGRSKNKHCKVCDAEYYLINQERIDKRNRKYREEHKEELKIKDKEWREKNKETIKVKDKEYYEKNKEKCNAYRKEYQQNHLEQKRASEKKWRTRKRKEDVYYKLQEKLRVRINSAIKKNVKKGSAVQDLGCSIKFFKDYIESLFRGKMTWENRGKVWQLDHVIPLWKFDLEDREQFLRAVNYLNMQPLTKAEHKKKTSEEAKERARLKKEGRII